MQRARKRCCQLTCCHVQGAVNAGCRLSPPAVPGPCWQFKSLPLRLEESRRVTCLKGSSPWFLSGFLSHICGIPSSCALHICTELTTDELSFSSPHLRPHTWVKKGLLASFLHLFPLPTPPPLHSCPFLVVHYSTWSKKGLMSTTDAGPVTPHWSTLRSTATLIWSSSSTKKGQSLTMRM